VTEAKHKSALKTALLVIVSFVAGAASQMMRPQSPATWVKHQADVKDANRVLKEDVSKTWEGGLGNFGIRPGDVVTSVNGITDQTMFQELVDGYNRGKVCVVYDRDEVVREVCVDRKTPVK